MSNQPIYVIAEQTVLEDHSGRDWITEEMDPDHGYFTDKDAAQAFVDELDAPAMARYAEQKAAFDKKVKAWEQKQAKAQSLGFSNPDMRPAWPPVKPLPHLVVEVSPNQPKAED